MTKLSRKYTVPQNFGHYVNNLWSAFTLMDSKDDIRLLFKDLFTHTEYKMFAKRLEIARRLIVGQSYEEIMRGLNVTSRTITNISNILMIQGMGLRKADNKLKEIEKRHQEYRNKRQNRLENPLRREISGSKVLPNLLKIGISDFDKVISKRIKNRSAQKDLII